MKSLRRDVFINIPLNTVCPAESLPIMNVNLSYNNNSILTGFRFCVWQT
jgi:hypothetical protein